MGASSVGFVLRVSSRKHEPLAGVEDEVGELRDEADALGAGLG